MPGIRRLGVMAVLSAALMLGACAQLGEMGLGSPLASNEPPKTELAPGQRPASELEKATAFWAKEHGKNPRDAKAALNYARNLKALGRKNEAFAILQSAYLFASDNKEFLSEYGRLALEAGQVATAGKILEQADDPAKPDWRVVSARGTVLAKQGDFKTAITFFERARELAPTQASVMNNLAMAYTMDGQAEKAEQLLRQASSAGTEDPRVRQNLALVLGLQGKHEEAKQIRGPVTGEDELVTAPVRPASVVVAKPVQTPAKPAVAAAPLAKPTPVAEQKPLDPDEVIRAAIEADVARNKRPVTPVATGTVPQKKPAAGPRPSTPANLPDQGPRLRASAD
jgi:Flp pilus assembly protein TadD